MGNQKLSLAVISVSLILLAETAILATASSPNSWTDLLSMPTARSDLGVVAVNGKVYAIGGNAESGYIPNSNRNDYNASGWVVAANEEYHPETGVWIIKTAMPTPRYGFAIAAYENKIYCIGGITNWSHGNLTYTNVNEVYDTVTDTWTTKTSMSIAANNPSLRATVIGDKIYVLGGGTNETVNQAYDPATDTWQTKAALPDSPLFGGPPNTLSALVTAAVGDNIYALSQSGTRSRNWVYNTSNDNWTQLSTSPLSLLDGMGWWSQAATAVDGRIIVFFGQYPYSLGLSTLAFNPSTGIWTNVTAAASYRQNFGVAALNDSVYVVGGRVYNYPYPDDTYFTVIEQATNQVYTPVLFSMPSPTQTLIPTSIQSSAPSLTPSISQTQTATPTQSQIPTATSVQTTPTATNNKQPWPQETIYLIAIVIAAILIMTAIALIRKRRN